MVRGWRKVKEREGGGEGEGLEGRVERREEGQWD